MPTIVRAATGKTSNEYALQLIQPLYQPANWEQYAQAKLSVAGSEVAFSQAQQELMLRVGQAYFDVLAAQDVLIFLKAQENTLAEQLAFAKGNFEIGTATITDTNEAQANFDLVLAQEIAATNNLEVARSTLQQIIGQATGTNGNFASECQVEKSSTGTNCLFGRYCGATKFQRLKATNCARNS